MKIFFISPRPFGLMGTPGTYHLVEAYHRLAAVSVVANAKRDVNVQIVHEKPADLELREVEFGVPGYAKEIAHMARDFRPDVVCITNCHNWYEIVERVKRDVPKAKFVFDIKSPLIIDANSAKRDVLHQKGVQHAHLLDLVITRCAEDVDSWIPGCDRPVYIYPLGVKLSQFAPRQRAGERLKCKRFVFIGSYSKNRKLGQLLQNVAALPKALQAEMTLDMYGSGPEKGALIEQVANLRLQGLVNVLDGKPQDELLKLLPQYDAGIGWVPKEIYDAAPSLKVLEYIGSGLVPVMTSTQGHLRNLADGFRAITFDENAASFHTAVEQAVRSGFPVADLNRNLDLIARRDWDHVAKDFLLPCFEALKNGKLDKFLASRPAPSPVAPSVAAVEASPRPEALRDPGKEAAAQEPSEPVTRPSSAVPRILLVSQRPFGLLGTPGTYHLAEAYAHHAEACVVAMNEGATAVPIVHQASEKLRLHQISFARRTYLREILKIAAQFKPNIVWIGNAVRWPEIAAHLREHLPDVKIVLDVKSPLLTGEEYARRKEIQDAGIAHARALDLVIALSAEDVQTWIPGYAGPLTIYPLGVNTSQFHWRAPVGNKVQARRFVFIGSYNESRKLDELLRRIAALSDGLRTAITLDMYGEGPDKQRLQELVTTLGLAGQVTIHGALPQAELFRILPGYDAGMGWVPRELYDAAPPLKTLEFMGSGLVPVVTNSIAHRRYQEEGFALITFDEDQGSFERAIALACNEGFAASQISRNRQLLEARSFENIVQKRHFPAYRALLENRPVGTVEAGSLVAVPPATPAVPVPATHRDPEPLPMEASPLLRSIDRVLVWAPSVEPFRPTPVAGDARLRAGFIGSDRLFHGLRDEVDMVLVQPGTSRATLKYGRLDFLLVESTWVTASGDWYMAQSARGESREALEAVVRRAKDLGIPTAYWMTLDAQYLPLYQEFLLNFDRVFCADPVAADALRARGTAAVLLPPAFQPRHFNPINALDSFNQLQPGFVYDGWADMFRYQDHHAVLKRMGADALTIIDTSCMMAKLQLERTHDPALKPAIRGWVPRHLLPEVYKRAVGYLSFQQSHVTPVQAAWAMLEAAACRVPPLHLGRLAETDFRRQLAQEWDDAESFVSGAQRIAEDDLYREKAAHMAWRAAHGGHTYRHRLQTICAELGLPQAPAQAVPKATLVTGTMRPQLLEKCIAQYEAQTHPNKELILVFNGSPDAVAELTARHAGRPDIHIVAIPTDHFAGTLLNYGIMNGTGDYFFRVDDDDHYGANYVADCLLYLQAFDADVLGKRASFFHFEGEDAVHLRKSFLPEISAFSARRLHESDRTLISGCSFAARMDLLRSIRYPDHVNLSADTELIDSIRTRHPDGKCLIVDNLNLVVERFADVRKHTWQQAAGSLKQTSSQVCRDVSEIMV